MPSQPHKKLQTFHFKGRPEDLALLLQSGNQQELDQHVLPDIPEFQDDIVEPTREAVQNTIEFGIGDQVFTCRIPL